MSLSKIVSINFFWTYAAYHATFLNIYCISYYFTFCYWVLSLHILLKFMKINLIIISLYICTISNALPKRFSPHWRNTQMHGQGWMPSLSTHRTNRPNTMHYRSWSRLLTQNGRCYHETSAKVRVHSWLHFVNS